MEEIHRQDVKKLLHDKQDLIDEKRIRFEKYKVMSDLINQVHKEQEKNNMSEDEEELQLEETTSPEDIEDFNSWAKNQAMKEISKFKDLTDLCDIVSLRSRISSLNHQQRRIFDDFIERAVSTDINEPAVFLFISGNAGTGKSHVVRILIEAFKIVKIKAGSDLKKPVILVMAPTANAAFIIGGRTIDSALGFVPMESNRYIQAEPERLAKMKFLYEDVWVLFIDEISMVGSKKLTKINFRLQDLAAGEKKLQFMGGRSLVASGD
jgi:chromosomal replication initiation ATPase DnaA